ncbi:hypothetical protein A0J57_23495 [Sphingobium sp. 22B]|nr:hypothetical protein AXW74_22195 [Sphingobium sp. AM]KYC29883.1 hypothetical protein A0J57_23495 [Sphingobium sp. 22B]OAP31566.1 hypothetical protein A8O16_13305 [Sphingobium sp. 20006FA]
MRVTPFTGAAPYRFWRRALVGTPPFLLDPVTVVPFKITRHDKVATAGSCFAQHISRNLTRVGFNYFVTEQAPSDMPVEAAQAENYGVFSARYGNVYTSRQFVQLLKRAFYGLSPELSAWTRSDGAYIDPFRPQINESGFLNIQDLQYARELHLEAVRELFRELDVFIFTLGLTETWIHKPDGMAVPIAPGVAGGDWDPELYEFRNLTVSEIIVDMKEAIEIIREVNPDSRIILTVSPVPLIATSVDRHILISNTYSKSALRAAAEDLCANFHQTMYFPSYEIITSLSNGNRYYEDDLRSIDPAGVAHVMRIFFRHLIEESATRAAPTRGLDIRSEIADASRVICDEEAIDPKK